MHAAPWIEPHKLVGDYLEADPALQSCFLCLRALPEINTDLSSS